MKHKNVFISTAKVWIYPSDTVSWHFVSVPQKESSIIKSFPRPQRRGFGAVRVLVKLGESEWKTSIFPDKKSQTYLLPLKASIRKNECVYAADTVKNYSCFAVRSLLCKSFMKVREQDKNKLRRTRFSERVYSVVRLIPKGCVMTYGQVADASGFPRAARAVGTLMKNNFDESIPCHRVVRSDGEVGYYNRGGVNGKIIRLKEEGVSFRDEMHVVVPRKK